MIKLFFSAFLCQLTIWLTVTASNSPSDPSNKVILRILENGQPELIVPLKKTDSFLANENLPIWFVRGSEPGKLHPDTEIMKKLGLFSMYQHKETSSAAVYFHQKQEFHGTIDMRLVIESLPIEDIKEQIKVTARRVRGVIKRPIFMYKHSGSSSSGQNDMVLSSQPSEPTEMKFVNKAESAITPRNLPDVVYIELLLIINYDLVDVIPYQHRSELYTQLVSYVITLINSADMLFSKVEEPNIKLNIAGIIIGTDPESFPSLYRCESVHDRYMDSVCSNRAIESYLQTQSGVISPDSYDIAMLLTSYNLREKSLIPFQRNRYSWGVTMVHSDGPYKLRSDKNIIFPTITLRDEENFGSFATVAHEIGHALRIMNHDEKPYVDNNGDCCGSIMREGGGFCAKCLSWSSATKDHLKKFFSSRDRCFFLNKPRSLEKPGPHVIWTADQQCQCYGYKSAGLPRKSSLQSFLHSVCSMFKMELCDSRLNCLDVNNKSYKTPFPMDGTPCNADGSPLSKVCWNRKCIPVQHHKDKE